MKIITSNSWGSTVLSIPYYYYLWWYLCTPPPLTGSLQLRAPGSGQRLFNKRPGKQESCVAKTASTLFRPPSFRTAQFKEEVCPSQALVATRKNEGREQEMGWAEFRAPGGCGEDPRGWQLAAVSESWDVPDRGPCAEAGPRGDETEDARGCDLLHTELPHLCGPVASQ